MSTETMSNVAVATEGIEGYRAYLVQRDGEADLLNRRLTRREDFFGDIQKHVITSGMEIDRETFLRNLRRHHPEEGLSQHLYWLLATAKLNQAERFGVGLGETYGLNSTDDAPLERVYLELEEHYHTRLLAYVLDMFGLPFQIVPPTGMMRQFVRTAVFIPPSLAAPFVGAAEMAGCTLFALLGARGVELFADEPAVADRIRLLYSEILTDEIGHVGYSAASCTQTGRALMRRLYPVVGRYLARATPEIRKVVSPSELEQQLDAPFEVDAYTRDLPARPFVAQHP
ncbi:MAG TPA: hypothetical protein VG476_12335 [Acidimicrobiales bacterium]|nr:hypothetical protein [Acidimicrobiales bacterium]